MVAFLPSLWTSVTLGRTLYKSGHGHGGSLVAESGDEVGREVQAGLVDSPALVHVPYERKVKVLFTQLCSGSCDPVGWACQFSVHGILQARLLPGVGCHSLPCA